MVQAYSLFPYEIQEAVKPLGLPWNLELVNAPSFWPQTKGAGAVVAVVDTGLDINHPEFKGRVFKPRNFTMDGGQQDVTDVEGHGTHVAGIIGGATVGVAPEVRIMPLKVFGKANGFQFQDAMRYILDYNKKASPEDRVVAVNCSWGSGAADTVLNYLIRQLMLSGVGVVAAAGNAGDGDPTSQEIFNYPGYWWECITTGALNQDSQPAGYSSSYDGIDLGAPGTLIYSACPGGGYKLLSGTSMATPHVCAAYALICAAWKQREGRYPTSDEAEGVLFRHFKKVAADPRFVGHGLLDLTYTTKRWPLYRVQTGAFYRGEGADATKTKLSAMGVSTYIVKY